MLIHSFSRRNPAENFIFNSQKTLTPVPARILASYAKVKTIKYGMKSNVAIYERLTEMIAKSKLMPTKEALKTFANDNAVISFNGLTTTSVETYNKEIESNQASRARDR